MILTYSNEHFPGLILSNVKIHTIRHDKTNRWKPGNSIQHWMHNPRNVSKGPYPFAQHRIDLNKVKGIEYISIIKGKVYINNTHSITELVFSKPLNTKMLDKLAANDGFLNWRHMQVWFNEDIINWKIIHWTDFRYCK